MRTKADGLLARLAKLEKLAGKGLCPCRLERQHTWHDPSKPRPGPEDHSLIVTAQCEFCGARWSYDLSGYPEELRGVARLHYTSKLEDTYSDPRAWAAWRWNDFWEEARRQERARRRGVLRPAAPPPPPPGYEEYKQRLDRLESARALVKDSDLKVYLGLLAQALALIIPRVRRLERRYGRTPFPELESRIVAIVGPDLNLMSPLEKLAHARATLKQPVHVGGAWLLCAEMEKVVLGGVSAYTAGKMEECKRRKQERIARMKAEHEQMMDMLRRRDEEFERRRPEHRAAAPEPNPPPPPTPGAPPPPAGPGPDPAGNPLMFEARLNRNQSPAPPPRPNAAPPALAPTAFAPPRQRPQRPRAVQDYRRVLAENELRRMS